MSITYRRLSPETVERYLQMGKKGRSQQQAALLSLHKRSTPFVESLDDNGNLVRKWKIKPEFFEWEPGFKKYSQPPYVTMRDNGKPSIDEGEMAMMLEYSNRFNWCNNARMLWRWSTAMYLITRFLREN